MSELAPAGDSLIAPGAVPPGTPAVKWVGGYPDPGIVTAVGEEAKGEVVTEDNCVPQQGTLFAGRYRLHEPCPSSVDVAGRPRHWRGFDEVLNRPVLVTVLLADTPEGANLLASAVANGRVAHPGIASVFDAANVDGCTYVVSEWVDGATLTESLHEQGPLPAERAAAVVQEAAETIAALHGQGVVHGNLDPGNVVLTTGGGVKLTSLRTNTDAAPEDDVRRLGALLYVALTGRWPAAAAGTGVPTMAEAPYESGRLCEPRQVRAGVSGTLSTIAMRALNPVETDTTAESLARELAGHATSPPLLPWVEETEPEPSRSWRSLVLLLSVLVVICLAGLVVGFSLGAIKTPRGSYPSFGPGKNNNKPAASAKPAAGATLPISDARILDPQGDGTELRHADLTHDGQLSTLWRTDDYSRPRFGNLKQGMGVLFDLGSPQSVRQVTLDVSAAGGTVELRAGDEASDSPAAYRTVAQPTGAGTTLTFSVSPASKARYWLVWFTELPRHNDRYGVGVAEVQFR